MQSLGVFSAADPVDDPILVTSLQGAFYGCSLPSARIEGLIAAHVPRRHLVEIADVYTLKWWDYRRMTPGHSFMLFAHHYYRAFKVAARMFINERGRTPYHSKGNRAGAIVGPGAVQYKVEDIWERDPKHVSGLWNAMLTCDALGMPYDQFVQLANQVALDTAWKRLPLPNQLYSEGLGAQVLERWNALSAKRLFVAKHPLFASDNYAGLEVQDAYREWLVDQISSRPDPTTAIAQTVFRVPQLPEAMAEAHFPTSAIERARLLAA